MYIITEKGIPNFPDGEFGPFKCEFISNRGTKVWPGFVSPDLMMVNWYRCRFMATQDVQDADIDTFLVTLTKKWWWWSAAQKLSWLVLGHGPDQTGAGDAVVLLSAAGSLLGNQSGGVVQQIKSGFGIDEFGVRQGQIGDLGGRQPGSRVVGGAFDATSTTGNQILSVGKRLSNNALLSYDQALGKAESVVKLTIFLNRQLSLITRAGSDNALDILYTISFGGPSPRAKGDRSAK